VNQSGMKDSNWHVRFNHLEIVVEKVLSGDVSIIELTDKNIFTVSILHNPQNDRLYASASSASQETAFAHDHQRAIHPQFCQLFTD